jgi:transposase-like protein
MSAVPTLKKRRRRSGTAKWHMSREAVDLKLSQIFQMEDKECHEYFVLARFGSWNHVRCAYCGTISKHYYRPLERRWRCKACDRTFSVTSETIFNRRKIPLKDLLAGILMWVNSAAGQPALELKRHANKTYNTTFTLQHKLRESLIRGYNVGLLNGEIEMDAAYQSGYEAHERRGRPRKYPPVVPVSEITDEKELAALLETQHARLKKKYRNKRDGIVDEYGRTLPKDKRFFVTARKRSGIPGYGAISSRVAIAMSETKEVVESVIGDYIAAPESALNSDSAKAYIDVGGRFREHRAVVHADQLVGPNGENNNQSEEMNARYDRAEQGIYLCIEPKYMLDYAVEVAWRSDTRRMPNGKQLKMLLHISSSVGSSQYWVGFTHGRHRKDELTRPSPRPRAASGPPKGQHPLTSLNGRPPR